MNRREIKEMEEAGIDVVVIGEDNKLQYATKTGDDTCCDGCDSLTMLPDPDPYDWFRDGDMKAVCTQLNAVICGSLEPSEWTGIHKPIYCPKLGRELTPEEKEEAEKKLKWAQKRMKIGS